MFHDTFIKVCVVARFGGISCLFALHVLPWTLSPRYSVPGARENIIISFLKRTLEGRISIEWLGNNLHEDVISRVYALIQLSY